MPAPDTHETLSTATAPAAASVASPSESRADTERPNGSVAAVSGVGLDAAIEAGAVELRIEFCEPSNFRPIVLALVRFLTQEANISVQLVPSRGGVFEVEVDGRTIFSKRATARIPDPDEVRYHVVQAAKQRAAQGVKSAS